MYKPKNPPNLIEWFKKLTVEERVNALSTVCPHLTEFLIQMYTYQEKNGITVFANKINNPPTESPYHPSQYHPHALQA